MANYLRAVIGEVRWRLAITLALTAAGSLTEGAVVVALVPVLDVIGLDVGSGGLEMFSGWAERLFRALGVAPSVGAALTLYGIVGVSLAAITRAQVIDSVTLQNRMSASLRRRLYRAVARSNWLFLSRLRSSDITQVLTGEIDRVSFGTYHSVLLLGATITTAVYLVLALRVSGPATAVAIGGAAILFTVLRRRTKAAHDTGLELSSATRQLYSLAIEHLAGMKTVKSYGAEDTTAERFSAHADEVAAVHLRAGRNFANLRFGYDVGTVLAVVAVVVFSVRVVELQPAETVLLLFVFMRIASRMSAIQQNWTRVVHMLPAFAAVADLQDRCDAASEGPVGEMGTVPFTTAITLRDVSFSYDPGAPAWALSHVDLVIPAGATTAVIGQSGAGKSTVADLVVGLVVATSGDVLVDDLPLTPELGIRWRQQLAYVGQDTFLFNDTVRANLLWAKPDATDAMMTNALTLAAADFVDALPDGLDTFLGDRGIRVSGGERQRLALARAILRQPCLLVMDEATSNLDAENAQRIRDAIDALHGNLTILVIAHDTEAVRHADVVYVLERGRLLRTGTWDDLTEVVSVPEGAERGPETS